MKKTSSVLAIVFAAVSVVSVLQAQGTGSTKKSPKTVKPQPASQADTQKRPRRAVETVTPPNATEPANEARPSATTNPEKTPGAKPSASPATAQPAQSESAQPSSNPEKAKAEHLSRGEAYLKESKFQEASLEFRNAIQIDDKLAAAHWGLAKAYEGLQGGHEMVEELRKTIALDANNMDARLKLGNIYLAASNGRPEIIQEAEKLAQDILSKEPNNIEGHILMASVLYANKKNDEALNELNKAISLDPKRAESHLALAKFYVVTKNFEKAEQVHKKAIEVNYNSALAHSEYAKFLVQQNRGAEAEVELRLAVKLGPEDRQARYTLASYYVVNKQLDKAEESYKALAAMDKDRPEGQAALADFYSATNRSDEAARIYQNILAKWPDFRGRSRENTTEEPEGSSTVSLPPPPTTTVEDPVVILRDQIDAAETPQERVELQLKLVDLFVTNGKKEEALAELHRITDSDVFAPQDLYNAGNSLARLGDTPGAIDAYRKAIEQRNGNYSRAYNNLGVLLLRGGRWQEAYEALTSALKIENFRYAEASYNLGRLYATRGESDLAVREWKRVLKQNPNHTAAREALAQLGMEGRVEVAVSTSKLLPLPKTTGTAGAELPTPQTQQVATQPVFTAKASDKPASVKPSPKTKVLTVDPTTYEFLQNARDFSERGKLTEAIDSYKRAISRHGGYLPPANLELSYLLIVKKQFDDALANLLLVANRDGAQFPISYFHLARLYEMRGDLKQAEAAFSQAAAAYQPKNNQFLLDLSRVREKQGDFKGALDAMEQYVELMKQQGQTVNWSDERLAALRQKVNTPK